MWPEDINDKYFYPHLGMNKQMALALRTADQLHSARAGKPDGLDKTRLLKG